MIYARYRVLDGGGNVVRTIKKKATSTFDTLKAESDQVLRDWIDDDNLLNFGVFPMGGTARDLVGGHPTAFLLYLATNTKSHQRLAVSGITEAQYFGDAA